MIFWPVTWFSCTAASIRIAAAAKVITLPATTAGIAPTKPSATSISDARLVHQLSPLSASQPATDADSAPPAPASANSATSFCEKWKRCSSTSGAAVQNRLNAAKFIA